MNNQNAPSPKNTLNVKYTSARLNLLLMIIMTAVNLLMLCLKNGTMLLFSATVPYYLTVFGMGTEVTMMFVITLCIAIVILLCYLLCYILSKKHYGWMIAALVMFTLDTFAMLGLYILAKDVSGIMDAAMHAWVIYYLVTGVISGMKLKSLPDEEPQPEIFETTAEETTEEE